jgi:phosphoglycolate phosphatase-like HAD superfamily hydrolase
VALSRAASPWLVLFDIDGTLLKCGPQIKDIFCGALEETFGTAGPIADYSFAGRTDHGIVLDLMSAAGLGEAEILGRLAEFADLYIERLDARLDPAGMRRMPGVPELLERLSGRPDVLLGLLTGNFERGARIKLARVGLDRYFAFGAFGDGAAARSMLPPLALERARRHRDRIDVERVLIVGDSVLDVECARDHGLRSLAVATGFTTAEQLAAAGADQVVADLLEAERSHPLFATPVPA